MALRGGQAHCDRGEADLLGGSLDGYVADEEGKFDWSAPDEELHTFVNDLERPASTYLHGRRMYEVMVAWETMPLGLGSCYGRSTLITSDTQTPWSSPAEPIDLLNRVSEVELDLAGTVLLARCGNLGEQRVAAGRFLS
jgi:hypothetical protein